MDSTANILQFCRLCLVKDGVNIPIFDEQGDIRQIYLKISSCLPVKVAREDHLPKKICDGCSNKLDNFYDFWRTSAESEKQLLAWLGATGKDAAQVNVKEEDNFDEPLASDISKNDDDENKCYMFEQKVEEGPPVEINDEPPPSKRPRRTAAVKAAIAMDQNSDDDGDSGEPITKMEDDSDETDGDDREPAFVDVPSTSADDQPGPSGVSKDGSDAPIKRDVKASPQAEPKRKHASHLEEWKCKECPKVFRSKRHLYSHGKAVHVPDIHPCDVCGKTFKLLSILKNHKAYAHTDERHYKCDMCDSEFKTKSTLKVHEKRVHLRKMEKFCQQCGEGFILDCELREHQRIKHDKILYSCSDCDKKFVSKSGLWLHLENHRDTQYTCPFCTKIFKFRRQLRRHVCKQKDTKKYVCDRCGKELTSKKAMKNHINMHKYGAMKYVCDRCSKVLTSKKALKDHVNAHDGIKPYKCDVCSESLASSGTLLVHKRIHTGEKPYVCTLCEKRFRQKNSLTRHTRTHVGEVPYTCKACSQNFMSRDVLKNHKCITGSE